MLIYGADELLVTDDSLYVRDGPIPSGLEVRKLPTALVLKQRRALPNVEIEMGHGALDKRLVAYRRAISELAK